MLEFRWRSQCAGGGTWCCHWRSSKLSTPTGRGQCKVALASKARQFFSIHVDLSLPAPATSATTTPWSTRTPPSTAPEERTLEGTAAFPCNYLMHHQQMKRFRCSAASLEQSAGRFNFRIERQGSTDRWKGSDINFNACKASKDSPNFSHSKFLVSRSEQCNACMRRVDREKKTFHGMRH